MDMVSQISTLFKEIRTKRTLVHHITNYVTVNDCANVVLAIGANPVMADDPVEVEDMVSICDALVINIGTLNERTVSSMIKAGKRANEKNIPVILDPVGVGATPFRFKTAETLLKEIRFSVIRGNMAEIKVIAGLQAKRAGVDSLEEEENGVSIARTLAQKLGCVIAITGKVDVVSDGHVCYNIFNGHTALTRLTGTGCMSSSLIGCFLGSSHHVLHSAMAGIVCMGIAGEMASQSRGLGSFKVALMDSIALMDDAKVVEFARIEEAN
jgi:hydroxyethylthiazole kinase